MNDAILTINASLGKSASERVVGLEAKVKASMKAVLDGNWMSTNDDELFRAGLGGALLDVGTDSEDGQRLVRNIEQLKKLNAFFAANAAGLSVDFPDLGSDPDDVLPLMDWWHRTKQPAPQGDDERPV